VANRGRSAAPSRAGRPRCRVSLWAALALAVAPVSVPQTAQGGASRSWLYIDGSCAERVLIEGEEWQVPVEYHLDANEFPGGATLELTAVGPWIDCPDGKYTKGRFHVTYPGMTRSTKVQPGTGRHVFVFTVPQAKERNSLLAIAYFKDASGRRAGWELRRGGIWFRRKGGWYDLVTGKPGNLFLYSEPVRISARLLSARDQGQEKTLSYKVTDTTGAVVARGETRFSVEREGQEVPIPLELGARGTFLIETSVPGWESRHVTFCRIPDVLAATKGARTSFGLHDILAPGPPERVEELCRIARRLGLTACRTFASWNEMEPGPGLFKLDEWRRPMEIGRRHGIDPIVTLVDPPAWVLEGEARNVQFQAFRCDLGALQEFIRTAGTAFKGTLYAWEWLNEIVPGESKTSVEDYLAFCKTASAAAKAVDPGVLTLMAGGLWPRSFRTACLAAGLGGHVDVLPVHYSSGDGVEEASEDIAAAGAKLAVWDDETGRGVSTWDAPPVEDLTNTSQSSWVLNQWPDELVAGCRRILYFGGTGDPAGNWSYLFDDLSPRPVAATLAVLAHKLAPARPVGAFALDEGGLFHLFEREGKAVLVLPEGGGEKLSLRVGAARATLTDYQGNETALECPGGVARLELVRPRRFLEGGDLDTLKAYTVAAFGPAGSRLSPTRPLLRPRLTALKGRPSALAVRLRNPYASTLAGSVQLELPDGWRSPAQTAFSLAPGETRRLSLEFTAPESAEPADRRIRVVVSFARRELPRSEGSATVAVVSPEMLGNLLPNGDFETPDPSGRGPEGWSVNGTTRQWASSEGLGDGLGSRVLKFSNTGGNWESAGRELRLRPGQTYLYTAWVWNDDMAAGSNIYERLADGRTNALYDVQVFKCGTSNPYWQLFTCRYKAPDNIVSASFVPVANGRGWALFDNIRVTLFAGSDFAAEAHRVKAPPRIDGRLDDWALRCPVPLLGKNQLSATDERYSWTPANLSGVAWFAWDDANLYFALRARDDTHCAASTGEDCLKGDSILLAIDPTSRGPDAETRSFAYYISSARPGGGSGAHTIYRPRSRSGGLSSGQLLKDSSVYDLAVSREPGRCTYELRLPWSELGLPGPGLGTRIGLTIRLHDNDGAGPAASMTWGAGVSPGWSPAEFGVLTLVE